MLTLSRADGTSIVIQVGEILDNTNAHEMTEAFGAADAAGYRHVVLDMSEVCFISSTGVGCILSALGTFRDRGGDIILCNLRERIMHILQVLDLCDYLSIASDLDEATASVDEAAASLDAASETITPEQA